MKIPISRFRNIPRFAKRHNERYYQDIVHCSDDTKIRKNIYNSKNRTVFVQQLQPVQLWRLNSI